MRTHHVRAHGPFIPIDPQPGHLTTSSTTTTAAAARVDTFAPNKRKVSFAGAFLDDKAQATLLAAFPAQLKRTYADHMTIVFKPSAAALKDLPRGETVKLRVIGYAADGKAQAVVVEPIGVSSENPIAHVTIATDGTPPVYSNDLVQRGFAPITDGPLLEARVGLQLTNGKIVFT